jgi:hypothetical protein
MTFEHFIHTEAAVGSEVEIAVPDDERPTDQSQDADERVLQQIEPGSTLVKFDPSVPNGMRGRVVRASYCGWLKVDLAELGQVDVPGWWLRPAGEPAGRTLATHAPVV